MSTRFSWAADHAALRNLLNAEFNPDWDDDAASWRDVADKFVTWNTEHASAALASLDTLLAAAPDEATVQRILDEAAFMGFAPDRMGPSVRAWLVEMRAEMATRLATERPSSRSTSDPA